MSLLYKEDLEVKRSPAKVTWWLVYGDIILAVGDTKGELEEVRDDICRSMQIVKKPQYANVVNEAESNSDLSLLSPK